MIGEQNKILNKELQIFFALYFIYVLSGVGDNASRWRDHLILSIVVRNDWHR